MAETYSSYVEMGPECDGILPVLKKPCPLICLYQIWIIKDSAPRVHYIFEINIRYMAYLGIYENIVKRSFPPLYQS